MTIHQTIPIETINDPRPHAVVVGSGFGGLAGAIRLGARGYRVSIVERMDRIGGRAARFEQDGFTFDAGPTIVTAPFVLEELWALCGKRMADHINLKALDPFYTIRFNDGTVFNATGDTARMEAEIAKFDPIDVDGFRRFLIESEKNFRVGFEGMVDKPFTTAWSMAKMMPHLIMRRAD
ncbi:MAG: FAD-dependent oxidoreductase, partial [Notoacmeibacter sp.]